MEKAYLVLADGQVFEGQRIGADGDAVGELVFTTGMCGYLETLTDPSYYGQIVIQTFPLIGNYGVIEPDFEGRCCVRGYVVRELCDTPSNFRSQYALDAYLKAQNVAGICGIDTRELTRILREHGVMNATICSQIPDDLQPVREYAIVDAVASVTRCAPEVFPAEGEMRLPGGSAGLRRQAQHHPGAAEAGLRGDGAARHRLRPRRCWRASPTA